MAIDWIPYEERRIDFTLEGDGNLAWGTDEYVKMAYSELPDYDGAYVVTPSTTTQVLPTSMTNMRDDVKIMPIPSNYGLISYDGSILTVS